jgi:ketosteroid isomerase-like protein
VFTTLKVDLEFTVREAEEAGDMAWVRSVSKGTVKILKTGVEAKQGYNQLVVFRKEGGAWKIRAYLYGSNRPDPGQTPT